VARASAPPTLTYAEFVQLVKMSPNADIAGAWCMRRRFPEPHGRPHTSELNGRQLYDLWVEIMAALGGEWGLSDEPIPVLP
jgi:hypothetical protein